MTCVTCEYPWGNACGERCAYDPSEKFRQIRRRVESGEALKSLRTMTRALNERLTLPLKEAQCAT